MWNSISRWLHLFSLFRFFLLGDLFLMHRGSPFLQISRVGRTGVPLRALPTGQGPRISSLLFGRILVFGNDLADRIEILRNDYLLSIAEVHLNTAPAVLSRVGNGLVSSVDLVVSFAPLYEL